MWPSGSLVTYVHTYSREASVCVAAVATGTRWPLESLISVITKRSLEQVHESKSKRKKNQYERKKKQLKIYIYERVTLILISHAGA